MICTYSIIIWVGGLSPSLGRVNALAVSGTNIFAGTHSFPHGGDIYKSTNEGAVWTNVTEGLINEYTDIVALTVSGTNIYAGIEGAFNKLLLSTNNGTGWNTFENGLANSGSINALVVSGSNLFAGCYSGVYVTDINQNNWHLVLPGQEFLSLAISGTNIFAGTSGNGVYRSTNNGTNWTQINNGLTNLNIWSLAASGENVFAGTYTGGIYLSTNNGTSWIIKNQGFSVLPSVKSLLIAYNYIFAGTDGQSVWRRSLSEIIGIQNISTEIPSAYSLGQNYPNPFNPTTTIRFSVVNGFPIKTFGNDKVVLKVYDVMGREVQTLVNESLKPGTYEVTFDGSGFNSGVYFYKLISDGFTETKKVLMIK